LLAASAKERLGSGLSAKETEPILSSADYAALCLPSCAQLFALIEFVFSLPVGFE
jgi:hypothetical protein